MHWGKVKLRYTDTLFSKYLRKKRGYFCEKCRRFYPKGHGLTLSHFWIRSKESVRFDDENCDILCIPCHQYFEEHKTEYTEWKKERMGEKMFNLLMLRAHRPGKRDDAITLIWLKQLINES